MKKNLILSMLCTVLLALASCGAGKSLSATGLDGEWNVVSLKGEAPRAEEQPFLGFKPAEKKMFGNTGCNNMFGGYVFDSAKGTLSFTNIASTMRACINDNFEYPFTQALGEVKSVKPLKKNRLGLYDAAGNLLITLQKR